jgi:alpha-beta hydrolase superfamily lysophospholipase
MPDYTWWSGGQVAHLDTPDGRLAYRYWEESKDATRTLIGIHGLGGNNDNYIALGEALKPGVAVYAIDLAGNGESGTAGDVAGREVHVRNLEALSALIRARHPSARHYLAGYSLGAAYASVWAANHANTHSGLILFASPFRSVIRPPKHLELIFRVLAAIAPRRRISVKFRSETGVDPRYVFEMSSRRFIRTRTLRSLKVALDTLPAGERALPQITIPTLIVHGDADRVALPEGARLAHQRLGATDKTLRWIPGAQHDLHDVLSGIKRSDVSDAQRAPVIEIVREWLANH